MQIYKKYITYPLEVILFSVTEGELFLVKFCDLLNVMGRWVKIITLFMHLTMLC